MNCRTVISYALISLITCSYAFAIDHSNLDEGRPLSLEDAYSIAQGEIAFETGAGFIDPHKGKSKGEFPVQLIYGAATNLQVEVASTFFTRPGDLTTEAKSGDLELGGLYNFNQETLAMPAFALKSKVRFPTGVDSSGTDVEIKGIVTKSIDRLSFHFNGGYDFLNGSDNAERSGIYDLRVGASYPIGAPLYTRTTLIADVFTKEASKKDEKNIGGVEGGFRFQLTQRTVFDGGIGTEFRGPDDRSSLFVRTGFSIGF